MSELPPYDPGHEDSATRTNREVGHRRIIWPNVEPMRLEQAPAPKVKLRIGRVGLLVGAATLTGRVFAAHDALAVGLCHQVVPASDVLPVARSIATKSM